MLKRLLIAAALLLASSAVASAQGIRIGDSTPVLSSFTNPGVVSTVQPAAIAICTFPANAVPCTNKATTYTSVTLGTPCSTSTQIVLAGTSTCVATTDVRGNWGAWVAAGNYDFTITVTTGQSFGPFTISAGPVGAAILASNNTFTGTNTFSKLNNIIYVDGVLYPCTAAGFASAIAALPSAGGTVNASACTPTVTLSATVIFGAANQPVTLVLPSGTITFTNTSGNGFQINGSGSRLTGVSTTGTTIACASGFTGDIIRAEPASGQVNINNVEIDHLRTDGTNCTSKLHLNLLSTTEPTHIHDMTVINFLGQAINNTISALPGASIPQHITFNNMLVASLASGALTADTVLTTANQSTFGPDFYVVNRANTNTAFRALVIRPTATTQGDGRGNTVFGSSFQQYAGAGTPCISVEGIAGASTGALSNTIGPGNTFELCTIGYQFTGPDGTHKASKNYGFNNFFDPITQNEAKIDFGANNTIQEVSNGNAADISLTANSQGNTVFVRLTGSATDISDLGTANTIFTSLNSGGSNLSSFNGGLKAGNFIDGNACIAATSGVIELCNASILAWRGSGAFNDYLFRNGDVLTDQINGANHVIAELDIANTWSGVQKFNSGTILPTAAGGTDLGSIALPFGNFWLGTAATNNFKFQPASTTGARIITVADPLSPTTVALPMTIANGTATMTTAAITAPACGTTVTVAATGVLTTDKIDWSFNAAPAGTNAGLVAWSTAGNVNFAYCPGVTETPAAATINWSVRRP